MITGGVGAAVERLFAGLPVMDDYHAALAECARVAARVADTDEVRRVVALRELRGVLAHWEQPAGAADSALDRLRVVRHSRRLRAVLGAEVAGGSGG